mmetsp:Transcript_4898/g.6343  ORF Transcript_4898/g.6343 Transcript_4898/m.6343 type:complete len:245 (+) Transcript_4898:56-790(+)
MEGKCNPRVTALFDKLKPDQYKTPPSGEVGLQHHDARLNNVFGALDSLSSQKGVLRNEVSSSSGFHEQNQRQTGGKGQKYCNREKGGREQNTSNIKRPFQGDERRNSGKGQNPPAGFVRVSLQSKRSYVNKDSVIEFLNEVRSRKGKPALSLEQQRPKISLKKKRKEAPLTKKNVPLAKNVLRLDHLDEEFSESVETNQENLESSSAKTNLPLFRNPKFRKKSVRRNTNEKEDEGELKSGTEDN